jgi:hypothetical protein
MAVSFLRVIIIFFSPTFAHLESLKNNFKFALELMLKGCYMFRYEKHHPQTILCSLTMVFLTPKHVAAL